MSTNIGRNEESHVNVRPQDEWHISQGFVSPDSAKITLRLRSHNPGCGPDGVLYVNLDSLQKLSELQDAIREFLKHQKPVLREYMRLQCLAEKEFKKMLKSNGNP